jgi:hypothetical protein
MFNFSLIYLPVQSGKTSKCIQFINSRFDDPKNIFLIFNKNVSIIASQTTSRIQEFHDCSTFMSKSPTCKTLETVVYNIEHNKTRIFSILNNSTRLNNIFRLLVSYNQLNKIRDIQKKFIILFDEADANITSINQFISNLQHDLNEDFNSIIPQIVFITATIEPILHANPHQDFSLVKFQNTHSDIYTGIPESLFAPIDNPCSNVEDYIDKIKSKYPRLFIPSKNRVHFIPARRFVRFHHSLLDHLLGIGYVYVILINGEGINIYTNHSKHSIYLGDKELSFTLQQFFSPSKQDIEIQEICPEEIHRRSHSLKAIIGNHCVQRGITLNSPTFFISHTFFAPCITKSPTSMYQFMRGFGNISRNRKHTLITTTSIYNFIEQLDKNARFFCSKDCPSEIINFDIYYE